MDETTAASVPDEENGAPAETVEAASTDSGAPATPPEGYIEQARYEELRAEFNRQNALRDRARQGDSEAFQELFPGFSFADDEEVPDQGDEEQEGFQDPRVDALLQERAQEREQAILNDVSGHIETLLSEAKIEVPQRFKNAILSEAWLQGGGVQITPETTQKVVEEWIKEYKALEQAAGDRYIKSKRAPHVSPGGTGATQTPFRDDMTLDERIAAAQEQARLRSEL